MEQVDCNEQSGNNILHLAELNSLTIYILIWCPPVPSTWSLVLSSVVGHILCWPGWWCLAGRESCQWLVSHRPARISLDVCSALSPKVRAVEWGNNIGTGLSAWRQATSLSGLPLRVNHWAGQYVKFLRVVELAADPHSSVLQFAQLVRTKIQDRSRAEWEIPYPWLCETHCTFWGQIFKCWFVGFKTHSFKKYVHQCVWLNVENKT